jgi:hypothetical protein
MAYDELEQSIQDSAPIEAYKFVGSFKTYRYTSADSQQLIGGEAYLPIAVTRSKVKAGTHEDTSLSLDLSLPFDIDVVLDYAYAEVPPKLELTVFRKQADGSYATFWQGVVRGFDVSGRSAKIKVPSVFSLALQGEIPNVHYQTPCNHILYDEHCRVPRLPNTFAAVVQAYSGGVTFTVTAPPTTEDDLRAGEAVNMRNGERRLILSNVGTEISIGYPFVDLLPGDDVELVRGCNHRGRNGDCVAKFNNYINFGGFEDIPPDNPFSGELV